MRLFCLVVGVLSLASGACGSDPVVTPPSDARCCLAGSTAIKRTGICNPGEVSVALTRCDPVDGGLQCGNGKLDTPTEDCDPSVAAGPVCASGVCADCRCAVDVCGDGMVTGAEGCEQNSQCGSASIVCRACQCAFRSTPVVFEDVIGSDVSVALAQNLTRVGMAIGANRLDEFTIRFGPIDGLARPGRVEFCLVILDAETEVQRVCYREDNGNRSAILRDGAAERALAAPAEYSVSPIDTGGVVWGVSSTLGLRYESGLRFRWESLYNGELGDRIPDSGAIPFSEIVGR